MSRRANQKAQIRYPSALHRTIKYLESRRSQKRRELYEAQDEIDSRKEELISGVEARLRQHVALEVVFTLQWQVE